MAQIYWPFSTSTVTEWPGQRRGSYHYGTDFAIPQGTPLRASIDGVITRHNNDGLGAYALDIMSDDGLLVRNGHLSRMDVQSGQRVRAGDVIGLTGGTPGTPGAGYSFGAHLHWELRRDRKWSGGAWIDPRNLNPQPSTFGATPAPKPEQEDEEMAFHRIRDPRIGEVRFADEMGNEPQHVYLSPDIGGDEWNNSLAKVFGHWQELTPREFDIVSALVERRTSAFINRIADVVARKTGQVSVDTTAIAKAVSEAVIAQGVKVDAKAIAATVEASLQDEFARIPKDVANEQAERMKS